MSQEVVKLLQRGVVECLPVGGLEEKLALGRPLRVKLGVDPTSSDLHLGHTVVLNKLRQFQACGHIICFIIGDFTARLGDPSGRNKTRPSLRADEILQHAKTYQEQVYKLLDPQQTEVLFNATWLDKLSAQDLIELASVQTVARMLEREDFSQRYNQQQPIALHEFLYPLLQGFDSVEIKADIELGGTDQTFNLLMGRELQKHFHQAPQVIMTLPLLEGLDGERKMSKTYANTIGITDAHEEMYGKLMSISDVMMWRYLELLSNESSETLDSWRHAVDQGTNPRDIKMRLALEMVTRFYDAAAAQSAQEAFVGQFRRHEVPQDLPQVEVIVGQEGLPVANVIQRSGLVSSLSDAHRMLKQGAVRIDGERVADNDSIVGERRFVLQVGKRRFAEVSTKST